MCGNSLSALGDSKAVVVDDDAKKNKKTSSGQQRAEGLTLSKPFPFLLFPSLHFLQI
jgi:hypothetical protein